MLWICSQACAKYFTFDRERQNAQRKISNWIENKLITHQLEFFYLNYVEL